MIPESWQEYIRKTVSKPGYPNVGRKEMGAYWALYWEIKNHCGAYWQDDGYNSRDKAEHDYFSYLIAREIRSYCRRNKISTRKDIVRTFDCRYEHFDLWYIVAKGSMDGSADGMKWSYRTVDGLKNLYLWF
jgi:hypothetical protein